MRRVHPTFIGAVEITACYTADVNLPSNLLTDIPAKIRNELCQTLMEAHDLRIERIVSHGQASPPGFWYEQDKAEWVTIVSGAARLRFEGEEPIELIAGSFMNIPARRRHRVEWTDPTRPTIWLAVHY